MATSNGFKDPFKISTNKPPSAIGSGRGKPAGDGHSPAKIDRHSPSSHPELMPKKASGDAAAITIRHLPASMPIQTLRSMLIFARDCEGCEFVKSAPADEPLATAIARFRTSEGAQHAKELLNGKITENGNEMKVDVINLTPGGSVGHQALLDGKVSDGVGPRSRFGDTFREMDLLSPRANEASRQTDGIDGYSPTFNPIGLTSHSPIGHGPRVSGRSVIQEDDADDETNRLLDDPVSFLSPEHQQMLLQRRATAPTIPSGLADRFGGLSINSGVGSNGMANHSSGVVSPRGYGALGMFPMAGFNTNHGSRGSISNATSPTSRYPPGFNGQAGFVQRSGPFYPPVNPADQNPPCNTLYVGNLPMDTSEDELKAIFSKQRGYKRLCFRTKQNGPMCFVEFEDVQWATRTLNELYGAMLSNSVRGGIRLSFSKNPLGVRGPPQQSPVSPGPGNYTLGAVGFGSNALGQTYGSSNVTTVGNSQSFSTANGPPPGLPTPQGYPSSRASTSSGNYNNSRDTRDGGFNSYFGGR